jgi:hypothetical protein
VGAAWPAVHQAGGCGRIGGQSRACRVGKRQQAAAGLSVNPAQADPRMWPRSTRIMLTAVRSADRCSAQRRHHTGDAKRMRRCEPGVPVPRQALAIAETMKDSDEKRLFQDISRDTVSYVLERMSMPWCLALQKYTPAGSHVLPERRRLRWSGSVPAASAGTDVASRARPPRGRTRGHQRHGVCAQIGEHGVAAPIKTQEASPQGSRSRPRWR